MPATTETEVKEVAGQPPAEAAGSEAAASTEVQFSDREKAIMLGEDPDRAGQSSTESTETHTEQPGKDAQTSGGGTEAANVTNASKEATPAADAKDSKPWYSDADRELASSYGMSDDDLKKFAGEDEFRRTASMLDRQLAQAAARRLQSQAGQGSGEAKTADTASQASDTKPLKPADGVAKPAASDDFDPQKLIDAGYDEQTVLIAKKLKEEMAERVKLNQEFTAFKESLQQQNEQQRKQFKLQAFHDAVDKLSPNRFGRSVDDQGRVTKLDEAVDGNRRKVFEATDILILGIEEAARQAGVQPNFPPYELLVRRAEQMLFADDIKRERDEQMRAKLAEQSKRRRPAASHRPLAVAPAGDRGGSAEDEAKRLANLPSLKEIWHDMSEDSGKA